MDIIRGDWRFFWQDSLASFVGIPSSWDSSLNSGLGIPSINTLWITSYLNLTATISQLGMGWLWASILLWILPISISSFLGGFYLFKKIFSINNYLAIIAGLIYSTNTYFLLIFFGGQLGVAFAYSLLPFMVLTFINAIEKYSLRRSITFGLVASVLILFDPRIFAVGLFLLFFVFIFLRKIVVKDAIMLMLTAIGVIFLSHLFWIVPLILFAQKSVGSGVTGSASFFSFAHLENSISLLHPNWPDNIFGKVSFVKSEFLLLPILAFVPLLGLKAKLKERNLIIVLTLISLVGIFLAKGTNEPFGKVYEFLYDSIPGFGAFRDSTKFYMLTAFAYSLLIPFGIYSISSYFHSKKQLKFISLTILMVLFVMYWIFLNRFIFYGQVNIPRMREVPKEYKQLSDFIIDQKESFRTLWIPQWQRYGYFSTANPAIGRGELFSKNDPVTILKELPNLKRKLDLYSIKYVIVPFDSEGEIFIDDHKYSQKNYLSVIEKIDKIKYLKKIKNFGKIAVFENTGYRNRFSILNSISQVKSENITATEYELNFADSKNGTLLFSESYSPYWTLDINGKAIKSSNYQGINSFDLPTDSSKAKLYYEPQKYIKMLLPMSIISIIIFLAYVTVPYVRIRKS